MSSREFRLIPITDTDSAASSPVSAPKERLPRHVAIIMDGNGRWAEQKGMPRIEGHRRGVEAVRSAMEACRELGIEVLSLYCLSSENWKRPKEELDFLMALLCEYLIGERDNLVEKNLKLRILGRQDRLPPEVQAEIKRTIDACAQNTGMTLCLAINYGARAEIIDACKSLMRDVASGQLNIDDIDEEHLDARLDTSGLPEPDLLIRTSGEMRISNFLLWQISYAELWVTDTHWPDFDGAKLNEAVRDFSRRKRRFGGL
ncbi:MAG: isoprenyl transferase [Pirellulaceae bacterium]|nr:isoprenyl transferase [Pirellulaceae bacterium]